MKKFSLTFAIILFAATAFSQRVTLASYRDTLSNAQTKYYAAAIQADLFYGSFGIHVDHLTGSTDSTHVFVQGSVDGTNYYDLGSTTITGTLALPSVAATTFVPARFSTTDAAFVWNITAALTLPYYRFKVQHYATGTVTVKGYLFKKK